MPRIQVLSSHVADLIAAGEVVERPASVAKELVENALDAGAKAIVVEIKNGGIAYLRVTDNGCGISKEDAPVAFLRHSTSKIRGEGDLEHISTLGFRGEALAAIASVSRIDLLSKLQEQPLGLRMHVEAGETGPVEECGCPDGTTIIVRNLFYNTPARMKFLKRDTSEAAAVEGVVQSAALSHPEVSVKLIREGKEVFHTPGDNNLRNCIYCLFGRELAAGMLAAVSQYKAIDVQGFVSKPTQARGNRLMQYFFVNGRPVKSRMLSAALDEAYKERMMKGRFPACMLFLNLPYEHVDVNVHPAKTEVKFIHEREVFQAVFFAAKTALEQDPGIVEAQLKQRGESREAPPEDPIVESKKMPLTQLDFSAALQTGSQYPEPGRGFTQTRPVTVQKPQEVKALFREKCEQTFPQNQGRLFVCDQADRIKPYTPADADSPISVKPFESEPIRVRPHEAENTAEVQPITRNETPSLEALDEKRKEWRLVGEVLKTYIVVEEQDCVLLIDKHAAHEKILFEELKAQKGKVEGQLFLAPVVVNLTRPEVDALLQYQDELGSIGFVLDEFGGNCVAVRQAPDGIAEGDVPGVLSEITSALLDGKRPKSIDRLDEVMHSVSCKAAIKAGSKTSMEELNRIVETVMSDERIRYCPHGRPVVIELSRKELEKQFKRIV